MSLTPFLKRVNSVDLSASKPQLILEEETYF